ncbi:MAG: SdpI family protein [Defluviitaleaceae bacterium]|nr:SdpI family protein [Defluviitaleaceae bacterium]
MDSLLIFSITSFALPLFVLFFGIFAMKGGSKKIRWWAGYRTPMACKNIETWQFAHKFVGKIWVVFSLVLIIATVVLVILLSRETYAFENWLLPILSAGGIAVIVLLSIIPTEIVLKKNFDKNGNRI